MPKRLSWAPDMLLDYHTLLFASHTSHGLAAVLCYLCCTRASSAELGCGRLEQRCACSCWRTWTPKQTPPALLQCSVMSAALAPHQQSLDLDRLLNTAVFCSCWRTCTPKQTPPVWRRCGGSCCGRPTLSWKPRSARPRPLPRRQVRALCQWLLLGQGCSLCEKQGSALSARQKHHTPTSTCKGW